MTLFSLLIIMALERVTTKSKTFHIATLANHYFGLLANYKWLAVKPSAAACIIIALIPSAVLWFMVDILPGIFVFILYLVALWVCLGCPVTRNTYKRYLQAANREDFEACSLYSESFGNRGGDLSEVGKQLVLVNYRQYASVIIFFVLLGLPGMVFYSLMKELYFLNRNELQKQMPDASQDLSTGLASQNILAILDFIPARITAFGFLLVGHFSHGLHAWLSSVFNVKLSAYDLLARVAKASESLNESFIANNNTSKVALDEPLALVKLVKRNIVFLLMALSLMTMVGVVA